MQCCTCLDSCHRCPINEAPSLTVVISVGNVMLRASFRAGIARPVVMTPALKSGQTLQMAVRHGHSGGHGGGGGYGSGPYRGFTPPKVSEWDKKAGTTMGCIMWLWLFWRAKHDGKAFLVCMPPLHPGPAPCPHPTNLSADTTLSHIRDASQRNLLYPKRNPRHVTSGTLLQGTLLSTTQWLTHRSHGEHAPHSRPLLAH